MVNIKRNPDYLAHHGIKGQKWGVRNGPPYPLDPSDRAPAEKTAGMLVETAITISYVAATVAMVGLVKLSVKKADERRSVQYKEEYYEKRKIKSLDEAPKQDPKSMSMDEHMKSINPDYPDLGSTSNCMFCTTAMAMRMKGYDVQAEKCPDGWSSKNLADTWSNSEHVEPKCKNTAALEQYLKDQGDGAYGNLMVYWQLGGGHSMFYHVDNGQVKIYDTQANKVREMRDFNGVILPKSTEVTRLDQGEPTEYALGAVKAREEKKT